MANMKDLEEIPLESRPEVCRQLTRAMVDLAVH
jgi:hypothetical protein